MPTTSETTWHEFVLGTLATIHSGRDIYAQERSAGGTPYVTAGSKRNGIGYFVGNNNDSEATNSISVARNGAVGEAHYHPYKALYGNDCRRVSLTDINNPLTQLFIAQCISNQRSAFSYGRKLGTTRLRNLRVLLPSTDSDEPNYEYMTKYVREYRTAMLATYREYAEQRLNQIGEIKIVPTLSEKSWKRFRVFEDGILSIKTTDSSIDAIRLKSGSTTIVPYITRSDANNGIARFVSESNYEYGSDEGGCITVGLDTQTAFWQAYKFVTGQNIQVITGEQLNEYTAMFLIPLLRTQMSAKFNWGGNGATLGRMKNLEVMLPVNDSNEPDWDYMEQYSRNMMIRKYRAYLDYLDTQSER